MDKGATFGIRGHRGTIRRRAHRIFYDGHGATNALQGFERIMKAPLPILRGVFRGQKNNLFVFFVPFVDRK
uniref:Uncharacterized protein n=1 Tax=Candidatus Kentrum sp. FW TaxID=2126338 RepID=A0A450TBM7_9GAMM|nr:MAG: hypothetical protein BECKFW1821B_GA0114236_10914 [Candidatus Kentron sp. FW]